VTHDIPMPHHRNSVCKNYSETWSELMHGSITGVVSSTK